MRESEYKWTCGCHQTCYFSAMNAVDENLFKIIVGLYTYYAIIPALLPKSKINVKNLRLFNT